MVLVVINIRKFTCFLSYITHALTLISFSGISPARSDQLPKELYAETIGNITDGTVQKYIKEQSE